MANSTDKTKCALCEREETDYPRIFAIEADKTNETPPRYRIISNRVPICKKCWDKLEMATR